MLGVVMHYCCDFYSLSVLSLYEGEFLGKVNKLYFDKKLIISVKTSTLFVSFRSSCLALV